MPELEGGWWNKSFKVQDTPENKALLNQLEDLARKDGWSFSQLVREALLEYARRHSPGNPQLALAHWTEDVKMPETVIERVNARRSEGGEHYRKGRERLEQLQAMTNEELLSLSSRLLQRDGSYLERVEINMILLSRRLGPLSEQVP